MAEVKRVLKSSGSAFVNLGDKYAGAPPGNDQGATSSLGGGPQGFKMPKGHTFRGVREKSLLGLPWAFALGCTGMLAALGGPDPGLDLILRAPIVLHKRNSLPESVRDRVRTSDQELLFHLVKSPRYYAAVDELREPHTWTRDPTTQRLTGANNARPGERKWATRADGSREYYSGEQPQGREYHPLGKLPGSVWPMTSEPLRLPPWLGVQHYAAFPSELPRRCILGWSPPGICVACGEGRWPVVDQGRTSGEAFRPVYGAGRHGKDGSTLGPRGVEAMILGYACRCTPFTDHPSTGEPSGLHGRVGNAAEIGGYPNTGAGWTPSASGHGGVGDRPKVGPWREYHLTGWQAPPTRPAVVLDPFGGTGTVGLVARALGRHAIIGDLSHPYCRVARYRIFDSQDAGKAISRTWRERQGELL